MLGGLGLLGVVVLLWAAQEWVLRPRGQTRSRSDDLPTISRPPALHPEAIGRVCTRRAICRGPRHCGPGGGGKAIDPTEPRHCAKALLFLLQLSLSFLLLAMLLHQTWLGEGVCGGGCSSWLLLLLLLHVTRMWGESGLWSLVLIRTRLPNGATTGKVGS